MAPGTFMHSPVVPSGLDFKFRGSKFFWTSDKHTPKEAWLDAMARATSIPLKGWAWANETKKTDLGNGAVSYYEHSHFFSWFSAPINVTGSRKFDLVWADENGDALHAHPNVQNKLTMVQCEQIVVHYLAGRKFSLEKNCMVYEKPIQFETCLPPDFEWSRAVMEEILSAKTTFEACIAGGVRPRSVLDIKALREADQQEAAIGEKRFKHLFDRSTFKPLAPPGWLILYVEGGTGLGKTKAACAAFDNPCFIKPFDSVAGLEQLREAFDAKEHDGIVFDEADLRWMTRTAIISLLSTDEQVTLKVRQTRVTIPANVRKIFVSNMPMEKTFPKQEDGTIDPAITRRITAIRVTEPTYYTSPPPPPPQPRAPPPAAAAIPPAPHGLFASPLQQGP